MTDHIKFMRPVTSQNGKSARIMKLHLISHRDKSTSAEFQIKRGTLIGWSHLDYSAFRTVSKRSV